MNQKIQKVLDIIQDLQNINANDKESVLLALKDVNKELEITSFKFKKTEQVKKTTAILLEETIEELEQKRKAVEGQNRELEIETGLERVRTIALSMNEPADMLEVCHTISDQLETLNLKDIRNIQTAIIDESKGIYLNYEYFTQYKRTSILEIEIELHPTVVEFVKEIKKSKKAFFTKTIEGEALEDWIEYRRKTNQDPDPILNDVSAVHYYFYSIGPGALGISSYSPLNEEEISIFKRFRNVFALAYQRFIDIEQAIKQAREAQIEAALERVRAKAMAMHSSEDLAETVDTFFSELTKLNVTPHRCGVGIVDADTKTTDIRATTTTHKNEIKKMAGKLKLSGHPVLDNIFDHWKNQKEYHPVLRGNEIKDYYKVMNPQIAFPDFADDEVQYGYYFYFEEGGVFAWTDAELTKDELQIFRRYTSVLSLTYRRYIDLKDAEAQAKEAQIEAALERVRSLALGMRKSEEVGNVTDKLFAELTKLSLDVSGCSIVVIDEYKDRMDLWRARSNVAVKPFESSSINDSMSILKKYMPDWAPIFLKAIKKRKNILIDELSAERRSQFIRAISEQYNYSNAEKSKLLKNTPKEMTAHYLFFKLGYLALLSEKKLSDENLSIARRFIDVFDFAYTRFLDIKKAEEQAKEAQIEAALERVRALAMSMHKSNDLTNTVATVFSELSDLGLDTIRCGIGIMQGKNKMVDAWTTSSADKNNSIHVSGDEKLEGQPILDNIYDAWQNQYDLSYTLKGKELLDYYKYTANSNLPVEAPKLISKSTIQYYHCVMFPAGGLYAFRDKEFSGEAKMLMRRFTDVFHLAFTRHLDLKQAEEQNKIIQAENERKTQELEEARFLQISMLPKELPQLPHLDIAVHMQTATEVGGDYYDFSTNENGSINVALGDATGHGMKAGIMVSSMKSIFTTNSNKMDIESFFSTANAGVKNMGLMRMMMGLILLNINKNTFKLVNAGLPPVFLYSKKSKKVQEITEHGMPIGAMKHSHYNVTTGILEKGDVLLFLTDGMPELQNKKNEMYGYERIHSGFEKIAGKTSQQIIGYFKNECINWLDKEDLKDDVTFVVIKVKS